MKPSGDSSHTQQQLSVIAGLNQLRMTNRFALQPITEELISSPEIEAYLSRDLDADIDADLRLENDIKTAIYLSVKRSKWKPRQSAKVLARYAVEQLRAARLTTLFHDKRIDARTYKEECENNFVQNTLAVVRRIKKRYGRKVIKTALTVGLALAGAPYAAALAGATILISALIPKKHKEKIKTKAKEVAKQSIEIVQRGLNKLKEKGRQTVSKVKETLARAFDNAQRIATPVIEAAKQVAAKAQEKAKVVKDKVKRWLGRIFN